MIVVAGTTTLLLLLLTSLLLVLSSPGTVAAWSFQQAATADGWWRTTAAAAATAAQQGGRNGSRIFTITTSPSSFGQRSGRGGGGGGRRCDPTAMIPPVAAVAAEYPHHYHHPMTTTTTTTTTQLRLSSSTSEQPPPPEPWITPALHNTAAVRSLALLVALGATSFLTTTTTTQNAAVVTAAASQLALLGIPIAAQAAVAVHLFAYALSFGTNVYTTFVLGLTMFKHLPRQTFGKLQAKLFPKYFALSSMALVLQLVTLKFVKSSSRIVLGTSPPARTTALTVALVMTLANQFVLEPLSTDNMMRRYQLDDAGRNNKSDAEYMTLKKKFGQLHGLSSLCNLIALCAGAVHGYLLAGALVR